MSEPLPILSFAPRRRVLFVGLSVCFAGCARRSASADLEGAISTLEASIGGRIGLAALNTGSGKKLLYRADERFPFCSTFKLIAVAAILKRSESENSLLKHRIKYAAHDIVHYSPITSQHTDAGMTIDQICAAALQYSDNTAGNILIELLGGPSAVTAFARSIGDNRFRLDRLETSLNDALPGDPRDTSTPFAMMNDLAQLLLGNALAPPQRNQLVGWMMGSHTGVNRIRSVIPSEVTLASKTGGGDYGTTNEIGVIWPPRQAPIILAIYVTQRTKNAPMRDDIVAQTAKMAFELL